MTGVRPEGGAVEFGGTAGTGNMSEARAAFELPPAPPRFAWRYDRSEILADGAVHTLGLSLAVIGSIMLVALGSRLALSQFSAILIYAFGLLVVLAVSATYNLLPISPLKWRLRRFDHAAIFLLIAATYTPFLSQVELGLSSGLLLAGVWIASITGMVLKLAFPGRFDRAAVSLYLLIGWSGVLAYETVFQVLPPLSVQLLFAGGVLYTAGVAFHLWQSLRFHNAIWHAFVLLAASCHYAAVVECMFGARA